jgi:hypothetical protein
MGGLPISQFENPFLAAGGGAMYPTPMTPGVISNGANNPNVIVVDTNQLTTRSGQKNLPIF